MAEQKSLNAVSSGANSTDDQSCNGLTVHSDAELGRWLSDFRTLFERAKPFRVEEFFLRHPESTSNSYAAVELIYEEFCLLRETGCAESPERFLLRFPEWRSQLEVVFNCDQVMTMPSDTIVFPKPGEVFGDFRLQEELGRGINGRVYLATQPSLSDRPVVVKLSELHGDEHRSLARLQHSSIVPLLFAQEEIPRSIRTLCMPYFGGCTLAKAMRFIHEKNVHARTGKDFVNAIEQHDHAPEVRPGEKQIESPALRFLGSASYEQAVCWIIACLADGLHYAHQRGLLHLDVKPSNVLLANDGQPMLLDFHLARDRSDLMGAPLDSLGGTPGYMAPEQYEAMVRLATGELAESRIDERSDLFSLALVMHDLLSGAVPPAVDTREESPIRDFSRVSFAGVFGSSQVLSTLAKSLSVEPEARYSNGSEWAAHLRRIALSSRQLGDVEPDFNSSENRGKKHAEVVRSSVLKNRGRVRDHGQQRDERHGVLRRKFLQGLGVGCVLSATLLLIGQSLLSSFMMSTRSPESEGNTVLPSQQSLARELHTLISQARATDAVNASEPDQRVELEALCQRLWEHRDMLWGMLGRQQNGASSRRLANDLQDLVMLLCELKLKSIGEEEDATGARRERVEKEISEIREEALRLKVRTGDGA